jgi:hypothetical protein
MSMSGNGTAHEHPNPINFSRLLRLGNEGNSEHRYYYKDRQHGLLHSAPLFERIYHSERRGLSN